MSLRLAIVVAATVAMGAASNEQAPPLDRFPKAAKGYVIVADGKTVAERAPDVALPPASLTKLVTALVLVDGTWDPDAIVTVSSQAAATPGSRLGLRVGDKIKAGDALTAMLVRSCNDAAVALAEHASGTTTRFVEAMNAKAKALGLTASRFVNPTGLDAPGHMASPRDLFRIAEAVVLRPELARIVALQHTTIRAVAGRSFELESANALLGRLDGTRGMKTGHTTAAGDCLVALVERDGHRVVVVLLGARDRWWTAAALVEAGFTAATSP